MARRTINTGSQANDGTGDTLRTAGIKMNSNFAELYSRLGGDSSSVGTTNLTDSGLDFVGTSFVAKIGFAQPTAERSIDFPDATGNVILDTATQTLTNKTISADNNTLSGIATSSFVVSNSSGNIDGSASAKAIPTGVVVGTTDTQSLTNKTLGAGTIISAGAAITSPKITTGINDANNNEIIKFTATGSADNEITVINSNGGAPQIEATGASTNINLNARSKGTGAVTIDKLAIGVDTAISTTSTASSTGTNYTTTGLITVTIADGTVVGEIKIFTNIGTSTVTLDPTSFGNANPTHTIKLTEAQAVMLMWVNSKWHVIGGEYTISA